MGMQGSLIGISLLIHIHMLVKSKNETLDSLQCDTNI